MNHSKKAADLFLSGYNCAQSVFIAFADVMGLNESFAAKISSSFGGGMGRMREVCGAVSGMLMVLGTLYGYDTKNNDKIKEAHYARVQKLADKFRNEFGTIICRELLDNPSSAPKPSPRTAQYYKDRPCANFVAYAAELVDEYIEKHPLEPADDLIYNQKSITKEQLRYGFRKSAATGCGWIAAYNALRIMGYEADPKELVCFFERHVPFLNGNLGTAIFSPARYFKKRGFKVRHTSRLAKFDDIAKSSDVCILFFRWMQGFKVGAHFCALRYSKKMFWGYNTFSNSVGPDRYGKSLAEFIKKRKYYMPVLFGISKPED